MADIDGQILGVQGSVTRNGKTKYEIAFSDGRSYTTFEPTIAQQAQALAGQPVSARVEVKQNGKYTNYYFEDVAPQGQLPAQAFPMAAGTPIVAAQTTYLSPAYVPPTMTTTVTAPRHDGGMSPEREAKIVKQSCLATASHLVGNVFAGAGPEALPEAEAHVVRIAKDLYGFVFGVPTQPTTPQQMAAVVNAEVGQPLVQVGVGGIQTPPAGATVIPWN